MKILLLDNYDSFTYNIVHYLEQLGANVTVVFNDQLLLENLVHFDALVISPGPGLPKEAGMLMEALEYWKITQKPLLGICLGMQAMAVLAGVPLYNQGIVKHGIGEVITIDPSSTLFQGLEATTQVGLYHSWAVDSSIEQVYTITARTQANVVMSIEDINRKWFGVQFHPESILTPDGMSMIRNFLQLLI